MQGIEVFEGPKEEELGSKPSGYGSGGSRHRIRNRLSTDSHLYNVVKPVDSADCGKNPAAQEFVNNRVVIADYVDGEQNTPSLDSDNVQKCVICLIDERSTVFVPCGHMACCECCADILLAKDKGGAKCPICRSQLQRVIKNVVLA